MKIKTGIPGFTLRPAVKADVPLILQFIRDLARYEKLSKEVLATEALLRRTLFGKGRTSEVVLAFYKGRPAGFIVFFHNFSTFLGRPGIYLEDLFVKPEMRGKGFGKVMLTFLARLARDRGCGRLEWSVLNWNTPAIKFYKSLGARPMDEWTVYRVAGRPLEKLAGK